MRIYIDAHCNKKTDIQPINYFVFGFIYKNSEAHIDAEEVEWRYDDDNTLHACFKGLYYLEDDSYCGDELLDSPIVGMAICGETDDDFDISSAEISIADSEGNIREDSVITVQLPTLSQNIIF